MTAEHPTLIVRFDRPKSPLVLGEYLFVFGQRSLTRPTSAPVTNVSDIVNMIPDAKGYHPVGLAYIIEVTGRHPMANVDPARVERGFYEMPHSFAMAAPESTDACARDLGLWFLDYNVASRHYYAGLSAVGQGDGVRYCIEMLLNKAQEFKVNIEMLGACADRQLEKAWSTT